MQYKRIYYIGVDVRGMKRIGFITKKRKLLLQEEEYKSSKDINEITQQPT